MNEAQIVQQQAQNIPQPTEHTLAIEVAPELTGYGNATTDLDEVTQFKLHDIFDAKYDANDQETRQQLQYIYEKVSEGLEDKSYPFVASKMRELMRVAGIAHSDRKLYKLYQWLRLSNVMKKTNAEMDSLRDE